MKSDIEIAQNCQIMSIDKIAKRLNLSEKDYDMYGKFKAKLDLSLLNRTSNNSKLILVTSINPTPYGEGKTTVSIGLSDAINKLGEKCTCVLREPSLGPVFGLKGGACGGGYAQVVPMEDINLHFNGDFHAITTCNNLLCAAIDNHIFHGNELNIDPNRIMFNRTIDLNDRFLRNIEIGYKEIKRNEKFNITAASEIMAIFCLASDFNNLKERLSNILVAYDIDGKPIFSRDLKCVDSLAILLKEAIKPNLVQTLENNPAIIHGGPFANIAHGCNSIIATKMALNLSDYVVTEAGFGSDLGAEKFFDIKCRVGNLKPNVIVINLTIRSLKYNGNENIKEGLKLLDVHIDNMRKYLDNVIVCINKFENDSEEDISLVKRHCINKYCECIIVDSYKNGGNGSIELAQKVLEMSNLEVSFNYIYNLEDKIINKINIICKEIYRASSVNCSESILLKIKDLEKNGFANLPICIAKTPYSLSDDAKKIGVTQNFDVTIKDIKVNSGSGFIVVYLNDILTLPGMGKNANIYNISIDNNMKINGLF